MPDAVRNNKAQQRFEMRAGDDTAVAYYRLEPGVITFIHTEVPGALRGQGVASQLLDALHSWCGQNDFDTIRGECFNGQRPMLYLALEQEYDIIGLRWDTDHGDNLILFQKTLA